MKTKIKYFILNTIAYYIFIFFICAFIGYVWEVLVFLVKDHHFYNRGFLYGPILPIYGFGAIVMTIFLNRLKQKPILVFIICTLIGTLLEFIAGWSIDHFLHMRYWDYTGQFCNFKGYICLFTSLGFGLAGTLWICFLARWTLNLWQNMPIKIRTTVLIVLLCITIGDFCFALFYPNAGNGITF
jgi:uncharacterized membrane protein